MNLSSRTLNELDLPFVKEYLKVDFEEDDMLIETIIVAAQSYVQTVLGFKVNEFILNSEEIPVELTIAALMLISHWYDQRQIQTVGTLGVEISFSVGALLDAHRNHLKPDNIE